MWRRKKSELMWSYGADTSREAPAPGIINMNIAFRSAAPSILASFFGLILGGCVMPPKTPKTTTVYKAPDSTFWWGTSTSPFQNEDVGAAPGAPGWFQTDWDLFAEEGGAPPRGNAVYSWTHFDKDLAALRKLGVNHFRFGIEWARVEPKPGEYNEAAIRQYVRMARDVKAAGIEPVITLWHFTFPAWLYDTKNKTRANFLHPDVETRWHAFVERMVRELKPYVRVYVPQNEPNGALQLGYIAAHWPPGQLLRPWSYKHAMDVSARMFIDASRIVKRERPDALVMGIYSLPQWHRNWLGDPTGMTYNTMLRQNYDQLDKCIGAMDLVGVNYYYSQDATIPRFLQHGQGELGSNYTQMGWEITPEGLYQTLIQTWNRYKKPMVISENGLGTQSEQKRIAYLRSHIAQMRRAMADGVEVQGYFPWTLVDNYEWTEGYGANFGLTAFNPKTKDREMQQSSIWFANYIKAYPNP
jgi:beta-glucosidase